jgi:hypothetical protein
MTWPHSEAVTLRCIASLVVSITAICPQRSARAQATGRPNPAARALVVSVIGRASAEVPCPPGAGVIVGASPSDVYIVTARHVLASQIGNCSPDSMRVVFSPGSADTVAARTFRQAEDLDIAVLVTRRPRSFGRDTTLALDRLGDPDRLRHGDPVTPMGCPRGECWTVPVSPDRVVGVDLVTSRIVFQSDFIGRGSSGGALFNQWWEVVGVVTEDEPPSGSAVSIDAVWAQLNTWRVPLTLEKRRIPRSGYAWTVDAMLLASVGRETAIVTEGRLPSARISLTRQVAAPLRWHASVTRLAPVSLNITAATAGAGVQWSFGRVSVRPFGEVGLATVEGRFDEGGYVVAGSGGDKYVPLWRQTSDAGFGVGGGVDLEAIVAPRIMVALMAAHWTFATPPRTRSVPDLFLGAGLRFAP